MLEEVSIAGVASYPNAGQKLHGLKAINFIFGSNGSGKTTISRVIADVAGRPTCSLSWAGRPLECLVYNSDFATANFAHQMRGIFTLGEAQADKLARVEDAARTVQALRDDVDQFERTLGAADSTSGKRHELKALRDKFVAKTWMIKKNHDAHFQEAFTGFRNNSENFCDKFLAEGKDNNAELIAVEELRTRALTIFTKGAERVEPIPSIDVAAIVALEQDPVLSKRVVGKENIDIASLIKRLGSSDWVRQGMAFAEQSAPHCPFCQQRVTDDLARNLNEYFDETYMEDIAAIERIVNAYARTSNVLLAHFDALCASEPRFLDAAAFRARVDCLKGLVQANLRLLELKRKEPSSGITLEGLVAITSELSGAVMDANTEVQVHNTMVDNLAQERSTLIAQIWRCLIEESRPSLVEYQGAKRSLDQAITGLTRAIAAKRAALAEANNALAELERNVTSVQPTVSEINAILRSFGFTGFKLTTAGEHQHLYELIRGDGSEAATTLSEGERSFITFLYFYHMIKGSVTTSGLNADRVVVFDDPVSSLDSDVLFIVSSLIRRINDEACAGTGRIKQVFLLTHNIYFHKEVSFDPKRVKVCRNHETFWIVRKANDETRIVGYDHNPITTSYEMLWEQVRTPGRNKISLQNTLRRILENYFKITGNLDRDRIIESFEGHDQQICSSLFSWVNDGSHSFNDDLYISVDDGVVARYLDVFRRIFYATKHDAHYHMMMGPEALAAIDGEREPANAQDQVV